MPQTTAEKKFFPNKTNKFVHQFTTLSAQLNTSIENNSIDQSHPHLPCEWEAKEKENNQEKDFSNPEVSQSKEINSFDSAVIGQDTNTGQTHLKTSESDKLTWE